jgi:hypothetical protein
MSRISAIMMPKAMSFIFMFSHHIFCRIFVPCFLKSCAWRQVWTGRCLSRTEDSDWEWEDQTDMNGTYDTCERRSSVLSTSSSIFSPRSSTWWTGGWVTYC